MLEFDGLHKRFGDNQVRLGGRVYAGALLRTSGKTKLREALRAERA